MDLNKVRSVYFIGIGGIGMSALARYFAMKGVTVSGYDKTLTPLTQALTDEGMNIHYEENVHLLPKKTDLVVLTPAVPTENKELQHFMKEEIPILKRSEVLGIISRDFKTIAVAGTHGKTTTSTLIAHMLKSAGKPHIAFLGGISKNYSSNFLISDDAFRSKAYCVVEADEFDRSFLRLSPDIAVITSADADHLDIYETLDQLRDSFSEFTSRIRKNGSLLLKAGCGVIPRNPDVTVHSYSLNEDTDYHASNVVVRNGKFHFRLVTPGGIEEGYLSGIPGSFNVENAVAAAAAGHLIGLSEEQIKQAIRTYQGVSRRFDLQLSRKGLVYIDDYAHHPEELKACIKAVREMYPDREITGVFQPHLYSRTRDFADGFAEALSLLDSLILLPIYPAREKPIPGITSSIIFDKVNLKKKIMTGKAELIDELKKNKPQILLTLGAGDIDQLVKPIVEEFGKGI